MRDALFIGLIGAVAVYTILAQVETQHFLDADRNQFTGYQHVAWDTGYIVGAEYVIRPNGVMRHTDDGTHGDGGWGKVAVGVDPTGMAYTTATYEDNVENYWHEHGPAYSGEMPCIVVTFDADDDGDVDLADFAAFQREMGRP